MAKLSAQKRGIMSSSDLQRILDQVKTLISTAQHAAMATVNKDGSPHNTPYLFIKDDALEHLYWSSHPESLHSLNVNRTGQIFVVLYEANEGGGLYIRADHGHIAEGTELDGALIILNEYRAKAGKDPQTVADFSGEATQRLYIADVNQLWVNGSAKDANGNIQKDQRIEISRGDLV